MYPRFGFRKENENVELLKHSICIEVKVICIHVNIKYLPKYLGGLTRLLACLVEKLTCSHPGEIKKTKIMWITMTICELSQCDDI